MSRSVVGRGVLGAAVILCSAASSVRADQKVSLNAGYFVARGEDARISDDVLIDNLSFLAFEMNDFNSGTFGGEWLVDVGDYVEAGLGVGYYQRTVPTVYADFVDSDGSEIEQDLKLRIVPITAIVRLFPLSHRRSFQPFVGGGLGVYNWRYSETGEFVDFRDSTIFRDRFISDGTSVGPVVLGGVRFSNGSAYSVGGEFRYQAGEGELGEGFLTDRIDLGGYVTQLTFQIRF